MGSPAKSSLPAFVRRSCGKLSNSHLGMSLRKCLSDRFNNYYKHTSAIRLLDKNKLSNIGEAALSFRSNQYQPAYRGYFREVKCTTDQSTLSGLKKCLHQTPHKCSRIVNFSSHSQNINPRLTRCKHLLSTVRNYRRHSHNNYSSSKGNSKAPQLVLGSAAVTCLTCDDEKGKRHEVTADELER